MCPKRVERLSSIARILSVAVETIEDNRSTLDPCLRPMATLLVVFRLRLLDRRTQGRAEAEVVVAKRRNEPSPKRRPADASIAAPAAAPVHPIRAARVIQVFAPLNDVPVNIVKPPAVWYLHTSCRR